MPNQLQLFGDEQHIEHASIWSQLPVEAKREIAELFAELLIASLQLSEPCTAETADESSKDPAVASRP